MRCKQCDREVDVEDLIFSKKCPHCYKTFELKEVEESGRKY